MNDARSFVDLACPACGCIYFASLVRLKHKAGGGLVPDQAGWACLACQKPVDAQEALHAYALKQKREELKQLEQDLGISHAPQPVSEISR